MAHGFQDDARRQLADLTRRLEAVEARFVGAKDADMLLYATTFSEEMGVREVNDWQPQTISGDATITNAGVLTVTASSDIIYSAASSTSNALTLDFAAAQVFGITLDEDITTLTLSGATSGIACGITLYLIQDGTGGWEVTWPGSVVWPGGLVPPLSSGANEIDVVVLESVDGGTTWFANFAGRSYS